MTFREIGNPGDHGVQSATMKGTIKYLFSLAFAVMVACGPAGQETLVKPGPTLTVKNNTDEAIECFADGWFLGTVKAGHTEVFRNMRSRRQRVTGKGLTTGKHYWTIAELDKKNRWIWRIENTKKQETRQPYHITIRNNTVYSFDVVIDGIKRNGIPEKTDKDFDVPVTGNHRVELTNKKTGITRYFHTYVGSGVQPVLTLGTFTAELVVVNPTQKRVFVRVNGGETALIKPKKNKVFQNVTPGKLKVEFADIKGEDCGSKSFNLEPGEALTVRPECPTANLMVINGMAEPVDIKVSGNTMAECPGGGAVEIHGIPTGMLEFQAWKGDNLVAKLKHTVKPDEKVMWIVRKGAGLYGDSTSGSLVVYNNTSQDVELWMNKVERAKIRPGRNLLLLGMTKGDHVIDAYAPKDGHQWTVKLHYDGNEQLKWKINPEMGSIRLKNNWPEDVAVTIDGKKQLKIKKGADRTIALVAGRHVIDVSGRTSTDSLTVQVEDGKWTPVDLLEPVGQVTVTNAGATALVLLVDDHEMGVLKPGEAVNLKGLHWGPHRVIAIDQASKAKWLYPILLKRAQKLNIEVGK